MTLAAAWTAVVGFLKDNPVARFLVWAFLLLIGWKLLREHLKQAGREAERAAIAKKQAEVRVRVIERSTEIIQEERQHADAALEARDNGPLYPSAAVVPDDIARVGFRRERGS